MIITRAPLRVGLFGGGSDFEAYFSRKRGAVLGCAITSYVWISGVRLRGLQSYNFRLAYRQVEAVQRVGDLLQPLIRSAISEYWGEEELDLSITSDLPSNSGLGTSSACAVSIVYLLKLLRGIDSARAELAMEANRLVRRILRENGGFQDPYHSAYGGLNMFEFTNEGISIRPISTDATEVKEFLDTLWLIPVGGQR